MNKNGIPIGLSASTRVKYGKEIFAAQTIPQKVFSSIG